MPRTTIPGVIGMAPTSLRYPSKVSAMTGKRNQSARPVEAEAYSRTAYW